VYRVNRHIKQKYATIEYYSGDNKFSLNLTGTMLDVDELDAYQKRVNAMVELVKELNEII